MFDHSNCGIGAIANLDGTYSHGIIEQGMTLLKALSHRGGTSKDGTGDGCGILMQIQKHYYGKSSLNYRLICSHDDLFTKR